MTGIIRTDADVWEEEGRWEGCVVLGLLVDWLGGHKRIVECACTEKQERKGGVCGLCGVLTWRCACNSISSNIDSANESCLLGRIDGTETSKSKKKFMQV